MWIFGAPFRGPTSLDWLAQVKPRPSPSFGCQRCCARADVKRILRSGPLVREIEFHKLSLTSLLLDLFKPVSLLSQELLLRDLFCFERKLSEGSWRLQDPRVEAPILGMSLV
jgi:hypothetical protein